MKVRATTDIFQKIRNPIKSRTDNQLSWKYVVTIKERMYRYISSKSEI